jgi:hypothetical protein
MKTSKQILDLIVDLGKAIKTEREANQKQMALLNSNKDPKWDDEGNLVYTLKEEIASTRHGHAFANLLKIQEEIKIIALETI